MTIPIAEELNVRERLERLFEASNTNVEVDVATACLERATERLQTAIREFMAIDFELDGPEVRAWSPGDAQVATTDQIVFQFLRMPMGAQFRCCFSTELAGLLVQAGYGGSVSNLYTDTDGNSSTFCSFFASNVALCGVREIATSVTGARSQNIIFDGTIDHEEITEPDGPGFHATWQLVVGGARYAIIVFMPMTEFQRFVRRDGNDVADAVETTDSSGWFDRMQSSLAGAEVQLRAVMNRPDMRLEQLHSLQVGDVVEFSDPQSTSVLLECDGEPLFTCDVGQKDGYFAIHVQSGFWS